MSSNRLQVGTLVSVPWGLHNDREGVVVELWGPADHPTHARVEFRADDPDDGASILLLPPDLLTVLTASG